MTEIDSIIAQMTLAEKAGLCTGSGPWTTMAVARLGVPEMVVSDGPHGVRHPQDIDQIASQSHPATCFPTASCLAATWNLDLIGEMGAALAEECLALGVGVVLGPSNNIKRTPLCGRNFEYFSEDPYLTGELSASLIAAVQGRGVGTSLKHYAANNQEFQRFSIDARVDERTLREIYLAGFEKAVKQAKPWTVMCAYNKVNGTYCSEHHELLAEILKDEWGFEGLVVSDWGAVHDRVAALQGGLDLEMPGPKPRRVQAVIEAVENGQLDEAALDEAVRRILGVVFQAAEAPKGALFDVDAHHALARRIAGEGMVLLKNDGILPLQDPQHVAVIGRSAVSAHFQGGGSSHINPTMVTSPFEALKELAGGTEFVFAEGYPADDSFRQGMIDQAVEAARSAEVALVFAALPGFKESEGYDRADLDLTDQQVALIKAVSAVQPNTVVILNNGSAVIMAEWIDGVAAVLEGWMMGQAGGGAVADILLGRLNPSGKLSETFPVRLADTPAYINYPGEDGVVRYGEGLYVGYRYYDAKEMAVQFPFGYGLSYTTFEYSDPVVSAETFRDVDGLTVSVDVTNSGGMAGKEIVQVYVRDLEASLARPLKELKGFAKVELQPGETKTVSIPLDFRAFAFYHPGHGEWIAEDGEFEILVGASAADIRSARKVTLRSTRELPSLLDGESTVREWLADRRGAVVFGPIFEQMIAGMRQVIGTDEAEDEGIGMDMEGFLLDLPVTSVFEFQSANLPASPEEMVAGLLLKVRELA